ncbi:hypothetical protein M758_6G141200 [Ceratodon purpureus]|nr:hypothetical protein M758_6G141200 [Ceratodon purpureus]
MRKPPLAKSLVTKNHFLCITQIIRHAMKISELTSETSHPYLGVEIFLKFLKFSIYNAWSIATVAQFQQNFLQLLVVYPSSQLPNDSLSRPNATCSCRSVLLQCRILLLLAC